MTKQSPIDTLLEMAQSRVDDATKRLAALMKSEHASETKLQMLVEYRLEYRSRFLEAARDGIDPRAWHNYSAFLAKLDEAVAHQQRIVDQSKRMTIQGQKNWISERNRMKAFDTLSQRAQEQETQKVAKQEQALSDTHSANRYLQSPEQTDYQDSFRDLLP